MAGVGDFFKASAWVLFILGIIAAIIITISLELGFGIFLVYAISAFVLFLIIYGIGTIIDLLDGICTNTYNMYYAYYKTQTEDKK